MTDPPPIQQRGDGVLIRGAALPLLYRAVLALAARHRRDGITPPPVLHELRAELFRATTMSPPRHELAAAVATSPCCNRQDPRDDWCSTGEAAYLLGLSRRSVQRMAAEAKRLESIRVGRTYLLRLAPVLTLAKERDHDRTNGLSRQLETARRTASGDGAVNRTR